MSISTTLTGLPCSPACQTSQILAKVHVSFSFHWPSPRDLKEAIMTKSGARSLSRLGNRSPGVLGRVLAGDIPFWLQTYGKAGHKDA